MHSKLTRSIQVKTTLVLNSIFNSIFLTLEDSPSSSSTSSSSSSFCLPAPNLLITTLLPELVVNLKKFETKNYLKETETHWKSRNKKMLFTHATFNSSKREFFYQTQEAVPTLVNCERTQWHRGQINIFSMQEFRDVIQLFYPIQFL